MQPLILAFKGDRGGINDVVLALDAVTPRAGLLLGFDIQVNDDADGDGTRDGAAFAALLFY